MFFTQEYVTQDDYAKRYQISKVTVWRMLKNGSLPKMITVGSRLKRWRRDEINSWISKTEKGEK
jgi:predicted DNA-binding transcriptional regulator AlpA